ncbi:ephrin type-A receptor 4a-like [Dysidea avara]|uniref:ephrin type-A receptor 4a-like n=1 Tax=Dysidea avara TaxID=196820 RepID=UPI00331F7DD3
MQKVTSELFKETETFTTSRLPGLGIYKLEQVAIKTLHQDTSEEENKVKLLEEAAMVEQFLHKNIVRLYGVVLHGDPTMIALEYLPKGNLLNFLRSMRPGEGEPVGQHVPQMLLGFACDVRSGMNYLSNKCFIHAHRPYTARNILLTEDNICEVADFVLVRGLDEDDYYTSQDGHIPVKWTPLETYTTASDVWSYGILLYEMWSLGHKPYEDYDVTEVLSMINTGYRLPPPLGYPCAIYHAMIQCW